MRMLTAMHYLPPIAVVAAALLLAPVGAASVQAAGKQTSEFTAQKKKKKAAPRRAPTRIIVRRPLPYYLDHSPYPRPDDVSWPGPNAVRQCRAWLAQEHRPSGTVIVPHRRCWWQRK
jgi:hypothetical protein